MKRLLLFIFTCLPSAVYAEWVEIARDTEANAYFAEENTKKSGKYPRVWLLNNYFPPSNPAVHSEKTLFEADCQGGMTRLLDGLYYEGLLGQGKVLFSDSTPTAWSYPPPRSISEKVFEYLCRKKP